MRLSNRTRSAMLILLWLPLMYLMSCSSDDEVNVISGEGVFTTQSGDATIEGELFLPEGEGPFPLMIIVAGSANEPRQVFEEFATILNANGYALYIFDKRGIGGSTGTYPAFNLEDPTEFLEARATDVLGVLALLRQHTAIDANRMGLHGSSQGAWVNSLVYQEDDALSYMVMASGGVASTGIEGFYCSLTDDPSLSIDEALNRLADYTGPSGFDPLPIIKSIDIPVLWLYGNEDRSHPARYDVSVLENLDKPNFTVKVFPETNHMLLEIESQQPPTDLYSFLGSWLLSNN